MGCDERDGDDGQDDGWGLYWRWKMMMSGNEWSVCGHRSRLARQLRLVSVVADVRGTYGCMYLYLHSRISGMLGYMVI